MVILATDAFSTSNQSGDGAFLLSAYQAVETSLLALRKKVVAPLHLPPHFTLELSTSQRAERNTRASGRIPTPVASKQSFYVLPPRLSLTASEQKRPTTEHVIDASQHASHLLVRKRSNSGISEL